MTGSKRLGHTLKSQCEKIRLYFMLLASRGQRYWLQKCLNAMNIADPLYTNNHLFFRATQFFKVHSRSLSDSTCCLHGKDRGGRFG